MQKIIFLLRRQKEQKMIVCLKNERSYSGNEQFIVASRQEQGRRL